MPTVGKSYGAERHGEDVTGTLDLEDVKEILETEDFGFTIPEEEQHLCPVPPFVRVCWGEEYGQPYSLRIFVAISELHLQKEINQWDAIAFVEKMGYVCYNNGETAWRKDRWGEHRPEPQQVSAGLPNGKGPMFHSWYYRLPPWMPGLVHEGEPGDYVGGTVALARKQKNEHTAKVREVWRAKEAAATAAALLLLPPPPPPPRPSSCTCHHEPATTLLLLLLLLQLTHPPPLSPKVKNFKDEITNLKEVQNKPNDPKIAELEAEIAKEEAEVAKWKEEIDSRIASCLEAIKLSPEEKLKIWGPDAK